jgi:thiamine-monophosphate kinase
LPLPAPAGKAEAVGAEFDFIERVRARAAAGAPGPVLGIGDDCAVWRPTPGMEQVITTDLLLEGVHFERAWCPLPDLGYKALAVNLSDVAAMGAVPRLATLALGLPGPPDAAWPLVEAFLDAAAAAGVAVAGGDTCASRTGLLVSVAVVGEVPQGRAVTRAGARPGDGVYVTGTLGDGAAGLALLQGDPAAVPAAVRRALTERHLRPRARIEEGIRLREAGAASAMIDVSDGLAADLGHVLAASGVGAVLEAESLPLSAAFAAYCAATGTDPVRLALAGGEDYELAFTVPAAAEAEVIRLLAGGAGARRIGRIVAGTGLGLERDGTVGPIPTAGYEHFV